MFESLATIEWQDCRSRYDRVQAELEALTTEETKLSQIYRVLWSHGGRCDCMVARNILDHPQVKAQVEKEVQAIVVRA